ncbi:MAG: hypothetical protein ABR976_10505 [Terracidiphilus sp.]
MQIKSKSTIHVALVVLTLFPFVHAQTAPSGAGQPPVTAASTAQAPDEATKKITDLVHAGKYADAQKLTEGLLLAYPDDQRLIKAKALIDKMLAPGGPAGAVPASSEPAQPAKPAITDQLTGMDKVDYNGLMLLARQAQQSTDLDEQQKLLTQFMDQSSSFLRKHPEQLLLWQLRAASAISMNEPLAGYEAGQKLLALGAADSTDPVLQQLMGQLRNKSWLDMQGVQDAQEYNRLRSLNLRLAFGSWSTGHINVFMKTKMTLSIAGDFSQPVNIRLENVSPKTCRVDGGDLGMITIKSGDAPGGTYATTRNATLTDWHSYAVPCRVNVSVVDKTGKVISSASINNGY